MSGKRLTPDQRELLRGLIRDGELPFGEIADAFDVSTSVVTYYATRMGLARRGPNAPQPEPATRAAYHQKSGLDGLKPLGEWAEEALCAQTDPEEFYPDKGDSSRTAKSVCHRCPVRVQCLEHALVTNERYGIWGGLSERQRRKILTEQRKSA